MRKQLVECLMKYADDPDFVFLTGDLGYKALESLQAKMGPRFINAGVAEQNMVTVAAGLAAKGMRPWCYSIAPFLYKRAFEQIANDCCQANQPVMLIGNGAGYGYGVMGPSHHAIGDYGALLTLPNIKCYIPSFGADVTRAVDLMQLSKGPCYLRLGAAEEPKGYAPAYSTWRMLSENAGPVVVVVGSIVGTYIEKLSELCTLWTVGELPTTVPDYFDDQFLTKSGTLIVIEEHIENGSLGKDIAITMTSELLAVKRFFARGYPSGTFGSKEFHRKESGLDVDSVLALVNRLDRCEDQF